MLEHNETNFCTLPIYFKLLSMYFITVQYTNGKADLTVPYSKWQHFLLPQKAKSREW